MNAADAIKPESSQQPRRTIPQSLQLVQEIVAAHYPLLAGGILLRLKELAARIQQARGLRVDGSYQDRVGQMLRPQIRQGLHRLGFLICFTRGRRVTSPIQSCVSGGVRAAKKFLVFRFSLENRDAETLAVRSHLRDVRSDEWRLNNQVNLAGSLYKDLSVGRAVFLSDTCRGE